MVACRRARRVGRRAGGMAMAEADGGEESRREGGGEGVEERLGLGAWGCGVQGVLTGRWGGGGLRSQNGLWGWLQKTDAYQFFLLWAEIKITMRVYLKNKWT
jgi:hypothetical protein